MKRDVKKAYKYLAIMLVFVIAIVLIVCFSENEIENQQEAFENQIISGQNQIEALEEKIVKLEEENQKLKENVEKKMTIQSDFDTHGQIMNDLTEIYKLIEDNKIAAAKEKFRKIETMGFDDSALAFYGAIKNILGE